MKNEEMELQSREIDQQIFALINCLNDYKKSATRALGRACLARADLRREEDHVLERRRLCRHPCQRLIKED